VYCHARSWEVGRLGRLELRRSGNHSRRQRFSDMTADMTGQTAFELALVSDDNIDLCEIDDLTEGEARWMARIILERRPTWFGQSAGR
jgi:hypothetical protein